MAQYREQSNFSTVMAGTKMGNFRSQKKHAIIPIFIPHYGCGYDCVFCNQNKITGVKSIPRYEEVEAKIDKWLSTLRPLSEASDNYAKTVELAFYGGSFTGIPMEVQSSYLDIAKRYKELGRIDKIHLSTRPDYIDENILENLKKHSVDTIELGAQSFDDEVLMASKRGHDSKCTEKSAKLIKDYGFELGLQLMVGLPKDTLKSSIHSANEVVRLSPSLARIYPTVMLEDTELLNMYKNGEYKPLTRDEAVKRAKSIYLILEKAGITIMRVGLKSGDIIDNSVIDSPAYHPAFRQLVESEIARDRIENLINANQDILSDNSKTNESKIKVDIYSSPKWFSNMLGNKGENKEYFRNKFSNLDIKYRINRTIDDGDFKIVIKD